MEEKIIHHYYLLSQLEIHFLTFEFHLLCGPLFFRDHVGALQFKKKQLCSFSSIHYWIILIKYNLFKDIKFIWSFK